MAIPPDQGCLQFRQGLGGDEQLLWLPEPSPAVLGAGKVGLWWILLWVLIDGAVIGTEEVASVCGFLVFTQIIAAAGMDHGKFTSQSGGTSGERRAVEVQRCQR